MNHTIDIQGHQLPILIRRHASSRRIVVRYQSRQHAVGLTLPRYVSIRQGLHFVAEKRDWIERQWREHHKRIVFENGAVIPLFGQPHTLVHVGGRGLVTVHEGQILVPGDAVFMERRVREFLRDRARDEIMRLVAEKANIIGKKPGRISLRDTSSRWGSCSHEGNLSFSWRLIFAPHVVLDYLVAHEVAHLAEHNHSAAFWVLVAQLCPDHEHYEKWLKMHGQSLHAYG